MKVLLVEQGHKVEDVAVDKMMKLFAVATVFLWFTTGFTQDLPDNELQVDLNTYFDSFNVQVIYPSIALTKRVSESSSINMRYLVDLVTAASIRSNANSKSKTSGSGGDDGGEGVDGVTSASSHGQGYRPDDVRNELGFGVNQAFGGGVISINGLYSKEYDYRSSTIAGTYSRSFATKNTTVQVGFVRSWDANSPKIFNWTKHKNQYTYSANVTQILSKRLISQAIFSYDLSRGLLSDPYEVVKFGQGLQLQQSAPIEPDKRIRKAVGLRVNYKLDQRSALHLGLRYYWDDWSVRSVTSSLEWDKHLNEITTIGFGLRNYIQSKAFFFKGTYLAPEEFMTVDSKLDKGFSNSFEFKLTLNGGDHYENVPLLMNKNVQFNMRINFYHRHTSTPNWFSNSKNLFSLIMSFGIRYRF